MKAWIGRWLVGVALLHTVLALAVFREVFASVLGRGVVDTVGHDAATGLAVWCVLFGGALLLCGLSISALERAAPGAPLPPVSAATPQRSRRRRSPPASPGPAALPGFACGEPGGNRRRLRRFGGGSARHPATGRECLGRQGMQVVTGDQPALFPDRNARIRPAGCPLRRLGGQAGSWLNLAEPEFSVLCRQCLNRRIARQLGIDRWFRTEDARLKLRHV